MDTGQVAILTNHSSNEGSRAAMAAAAEILTGQPPVLVDARHFADTGGGRVNVSGRSLQLESVAIPYVQAHLSMLQPSTKMT